MKKIAILSFHSGRLNRGVESWAQQVQYHLKESQVEIISGKDVYNPLVYLTADVVISTGGRFEVLLCRLATWACGRPMVVFGHSGPGADDKWNLLCSPTVFVAFSHSQEQWAKKHKWPWTRTMVIHHAVDTGRFTPADMPVKKNIVLAVAARQPNKRIELVEAAVGNIPKCKLLVVGPGNSLEVPFAKMPEIYQRAKVFCLVPQPWEAFGLVFLEALACNLPVVTIDDLVRREIVGQAGILVNPSNAGELEQAIKTALQKDWGRIPRLRAEKFAWTKISADYYLLWASLS